MLPVDPPVRAVWVTAGNPVAMLPDSRLTAQALRTREFTVVADSFLTDTAQCAHLVLPTATLLEEVEFEAFLRDAGGFSHAAAKAIANGGYKANPNPRDEGGMDDLLDLQRQAESLFSTT